MRPDMLRGRPLREPEPTQIGVGVEKVAVTMAITLLNGQVVTYEFHNVGFDPLQVGALRGAHRTHGIDLAQWRSDDEDGLDFSRRDQLVTTQQTPEELDLRIRGTLRPKSDTEDETGRWSVTTPEESQ